jgi:hypothetical protein
MRGPVEVAAAAIAIVGIVSVANAAVVNEKCIATADVVCPIGHYIPSCTGSLPQFVVDPGNGVTSIIINSSAVILDTHNQLGVGFEYAITANCNGKYDSDAHSDLTPVGDPTSQRELGGDKGRLAAGAGGW